MPIAPQSHTAAVAAATARETPDLSRRLRAEFLLVLPQGASGNGHRRPAPRSVDAPIGRRRRGRPVIGPARTNEVVGWRGAEAGAGEHLRMGGISSFRAALESGLAWLRGAKTWDPRVASTGPAAPWRGPSSRGARRPQGWGGGSPLRQVSLLWPGTTSALGLSVRLPNSGGGRGEKTTIKAAPNTQESRQMIF